MNFIMDPMGRDLDRGKIEKAGFQRLDIAKDTQTDRSEWEWEIDVSIHQYMSNFTDDKLMVTSDDDKSPQKRYAEAFSHLLSTYGPRGMPVEVLPFRLRRELEEANRGSGDLVYTRPRWLIRLYAVWACAYVCDSLRNTLPPDQLPKPHIPNETADELAYLVFLRDALLDDYKMTSRRLGNVTTSAFSCNFL